MTTESTMKLTEFMQAAKQEAVKYGMTELDKISVYAFCEFDKTFFVCQIAIENDILRAPIMHTPEDAIAAFGDAMRHYQINGKQKSNTDLAL